MQCFAKFSSSVRWLTAISFVLGVQVANAAPVLLTNAGFEQQWESAGFGTDGVAVFNYNPTGAGMGWAFGYTGNGVSSSYSLLQAYEGTRFGFLQTGRLDDSFGPLGATISQSFTLNGNSDLAVGFALALRPGYATGQHVRVGIDGVLIADLAAISTGWVVQSISVTGLSAGTHSLTFAGTGANGMDTTAFIDAVTLDAVPAQVGHQNVPEPGTLGLIGLGLAFIFNRQRHRSRLSA